MTRDPWSHLASRTPARIAIGRAGGSLPTSEVLAFALAHAKARDAVHATFDPERIAAGLGDLGLAAVTVESLARDRAAYLRRPDWGRALAETSRSRLAACAEAPGDLVIVIADGLSATAVETNALALVGALLPRLASAGIAIGPVVVATGARVALGDAVAAELGARAVLVLIGERPGLSSPDSLGAYLTFDARPGRNDAERNCVSNIRAGGLAVELAAFKLSWLAAEAFRRQLTGISLKDESDLLLAPGGAPPGLAGQG
ncbi:ethanolamine ammonia-lyase subunit EutC [Phreatobacter stygius]|uniref:Ethanolamine ammonia-lyase small subunit n=1 Tax=Phreatobacter stygius TaxID=1940610 RepID=A0A4D7B210_9HYPH|nr:ethanolamine ammonia-lyase subunit EutC [Phreatobacter stygius]QCI65043.1 ethanolamine ammonia-lyase subunit EutC [Phreatobacter stygius]